MRVLLSGASGLIGSALAPALTESGHRITRLVRSEPNTAAGEVFWDPQAGQLELGPLEGTDAAVHLAGETIAGRWTADKKARIWESRVKSTLLLAESLGRLKSPLQVFLSASAVGYYGDRGEELLNEESAPGKGFLADVCRNWESAAAVIEPLGIRTVQLRTGVLLSPHGGALQRMLPAFRMGVGGRLGSGRQYMSWIAMDDLIGIILHLLATPSLRGPVNAVAPNPVTNREFTKTLGRVLHRPTICPAPAFAIRLGLGEMGQELLLASTRVEPAKLNASGYAFQHPHLEGALRSLLGQRNWRKS